MTITLTNLHSLLATQGDPPYARASGTGRPRENKRDSRRFRFSERLQDTIGRSIFYFQTEPLRVGVTFAPFSRLTVPVMPMAPLKEPTLPLA